MATLRDINDETSREITGYRNHTAGVLTINAATAATFKSTNAYSYICDGLFKSKAALAAQAFSAGHAVQAIGQTQYYAVGLDAAGNVSTYQGAPASASAQAAALAQGQPATSVVGAVPDVANGVTPVALIKVVTTSAAFTPNVTALDAAGIAVSYFDVAVLPSVAP
jgi:hypothetical protein